MCTESWTKWWLNQRKKSVKCREQLRESSRGRLFVAVVERSALSINAPRRWPRPTKAKSWTILPKCSTDSTQDRKSLNGPVSVLQSAKDTIFHLDFVWLGRRGLILMSGSGSLYFGDECRQSVRVQGIANTTDVSHQTCYRHRRWLIITISIKYGYRLLGDRTETASSK